MIEHSVTVTVAVPILTLVNLVADSLNSFNTTAVLMVVVIVVPLDA